MNTIEEAVHAGFDMSLIEESLRSSPEERALQHQAALEMALQLEAAFQKSKGQIDRDGTQPTSATPV
ncbi:MAG: hypothetical protein ACPG4N_07025 [Gammaproteobacteria bacterium]